MPSEKMLMRGSHVVGEAAVRAGCRFYAGYPITPQNELPEYLSARIVEVGGTFIQGESEIASINMVLGAAAAGARAMTSSSSPGLALKQEGISYLGRDGIARRGRQHDERGSGAREHCTLGRRLLSGHERRRQRRLPHPGARSCRMPGIVRPHLRGL